MALTRFRGHFDLPPKSGVAILERLQDAGRVQGKQLIDELVKRLNNDAAVKANRWIEEFGTAQTVPAAVIGGVFEAHNLRAAQESG